MFQEQKKKPLFQEEQKKKGQLGEDKKKPAFGGAGCGGMKDDKKEGQKM